MYFPVFFDILRFLLQTFMPHLTMTHCLSLLLPAIRRGLTMDYTAARHTQSKTPAAAGGLALCSTNFRTSAYPFFFS